MEDGHQAGPGRRRGWLGYLPRAAGLTTVLGSWPRLSTLSPIWFTAAVAAELASFTCNFALQRLALRTKGWFAVITAGLAGNAVTHSLPGGDAAGAAAQFSVLATAGFDTDTAVGGLTAFSLLGVGGLLALPVLRCPPYWPARQPARGSSTLPCLASPGSSCSRSSAWSSCVPSGRWPQSAAPCRA